FNFISTNTGAVICFFLLPGFPKDVLCYILGLTGMKLSTFLIVSTLGRMPGTYLLTVQGASLRSQDYATTVLVAVISVVLVLLGYLYKDRFVHRMKSKAG
ncbi:MAG: TVP38/TMEM64 family protein, partial [Deltaproteobacteria bacterium]